MKAKKKDSSREEHWRGLMNRQEQGGTSIQKFCLEHGVSPASFYQWRRRLSGTPGVMKFALVEPAAATGSAAIELRLAGGEQLRIYAGADAATLEMILDVLRPPHR